MSIKLKRHAKLLPPRSKSERLARTPKRRLASQRGSRTILLKRDAYSPVRCLASCCTVQSARTSAWHLHSPCIASTSPAVTRLFHRCGLCNEKFWFFKRRHHCRKVPPSVCSLYAMLTSVRAAAVRMLGVWWLQLRPVCALQLPHRTEKFLTQDAVTFLAWRWTGLRCISLLLAQDR